MVTPAPGAPGGGCWRTPGRSSPPQRRRWQCCAAWLGRPAGCTPAGAGCAQSQQSRAWCGGHSGWSRQQQGAAQTAGAQEAGRGGAAISSQRVALAGKAGARHAPSLPTRLPACLPGGLTSPLLNPWATYNWTARVTVLPKEGTSPSRLSAWAQASSSPTTTCTARRREVSGHSSSVGQGQSLISGGAADAGAGAGRAGCWQGLTAWMWWAGS